MIGVDNWQPMMATNDGVDWGWTFVIQMTQFASKNMKILR
jgi:hypothetical protein